MKTLRVFLRVLFRALLIIAIFAVFVSCFNLVKTHNQNIHTLNKNRITGFIILLVPGVLQLALLLFPSIPFAPYIAAINGFLIGIDSFSAIAVTFSLVPEFGEFKAFMIILAVVSYLIFPITSYRWVMERRNRKTGFGISDPTDSFSNRTKALIPRELEGKVLGFCVNLLAVLFFIVLGIVFLKDNLSSGTSGSITIGSLLGSISPFFLGGLLLFLTREDFILIRDGFRKRRSFADGIDPAEMELAAQDFNNAQRYLDGRIMLGDQYIFGNKSSEFVEYRKLSAIIIIALPARRVLTANGPILENLAEHVVNVYAVQQADHQFVAKTTDGQAYVLCDLPGTNAFQSYEKYWEKELLPVLERIYEKNPECEFWPSIR